MNTEERAALKAQKKAQKLAIKEARKQEEKELRGWNEMVRKAKEKGAFIEDNPGEDTDEYTGAFAD